MSSLFYLVLFFLSNHVFAQDSLVIPGFVFDPTGTNVANNQHVSNIINQGWATSVGWNPNPNLQINNYFFAQFSWSSQATAGWTKSKMLINGLTISVSADGVHTPTRIGVLPQGGTNISEAIQVWDIARPNPTGDRQTLNLEFAIPQALVDFTVFFYNGANHYQVYIYQIQFRGFGAITPVSVIDPFNIPVFPGRGIENMIQPSTNYWDPRPDSIPDQFKRFHAVVNLPSTLQVGRIWDIIGFQVWTTLDETHTFSQVDVSLGSQYSAANVWQTFNFSSSSLAPIERVRVDGVSSGWASFMFSKPVYSDQLALSFYNGNSQSQTRLIGIRFFVASNTVCAAGYYNNGTVPYPSCVACPSGWFSLSGSMSCSRCRSDSTSSSCKCTQNFAPRLQGGSRQSISTAPLQPATQLSIVSGYHYSTSFTVAAWISPAATAETNFTTLMPMYVLGWTEAMKIRITQSQKLLVEFPSYLASLTLTSPSIIKPNQWTHVAVTVTVTTVPTTRDSTIVATLYVNGSVARSGSSDWVATGYPAMYLNEQTNQQAQQMTWGGCYTTLSVQQLRSFGIAPWNLETSPMTVPCDYVSIIDGTWSNPVSSPLDLFRLKRLETSLQAEQFQVSSLVASYINQHSLGIPSHDNWLSDICAQVGSSCTGALNRASGIASTINSSFPWTNYRSASSPDGFFTGQLDDLLMFSTALSAEQVSLLQFQPLLNLVNGSSQSSPQPSSDIPSALLPVISSNLVLFVPFPQWLSSFPAAVVGTSSYLPNDRDRWMLHENGPVCYPRSTAAAGSYPLVPGSATSSSALCPAGYFSLESMQLCLPCGMSTFSNTSGSTQCFPCPLGAATTMKDASTTCSVAISANDHAALALQVYQLHQAAISGGSKPNEFLVAVTATMGTISSLIGASLIGPLFAQLMSAQVYSVLYDLELAAGEVQVSILNLPKLLGLVYSILGVASWIQLALIETCHLACMGYNPPPQCHPGNFRNSTSLACQICPLNTYSDVDESASCATCKWPWFSNPGSVRCTTCKEQLQMDNYWPTPGTNKCVPTAVPTKPGPVSTYNSTLALGFTGWMDALLDLGDQLPADLINCETLLAPYISRPWSSQMPGGGGDDDDDEKMDPCDASSTSVAARRLNVNDLDTMQSALGYYSGRIESNYNLLPPIIQDNTHPLELNSRGIISSSSNLANLPLSLLPDAGGVYPSTAQVAQLVRTGTVWNSIVSRMWAIRQYYVGIAADMVRRNPQARIPERWWNRMETEMISVITRSLVDSEDQDTPLVENFGEMGLPTNSHNINDANHVNIERVTNPTSLPEAMPRLLRGLPDVVIQMISSVRDMRSGDAVTVPITVLGEIKTEEADDDARAMQRAITQALWNGIIAWDRNIQRLGDGYFAVSDETQDARIADVTVYVTTSATARIYTITSLHDDRVQPNHFEVYQTEQFDLSNQEDFSAFYHQIYLRTWQHIGFSEGEDVAERIMARFDPFPC